MCDRVKWNRIESNRIESIRVESSRVDEKANGSEQSREDVEGHDPD